MPAAFNFVEGFAVQWLTPFLWASARFKFHVSKFIWLKPFLSLMLFITTSNYLKPFQTTINLETQKLRNLETQKQRSEKHRNPET